MALSYKNLWKLLIDRDMTRKDLHQATGISHATLAKMSRGESVTAAVLERICKELGCQIENVVQIVPDDKLSSTSTPYAKRLSRASIANGYDERRI